MAGTARRDDGTASGQPPRKRSSGAQPPASVDYNDPLDEEFYASLRAVLETENRDDRNRVTVNGPGW